MVSLVFEKKNIFFKSVTSENFLNFWRVVDYELGVRKWLSNTLVSGLLISDLFKKFVISSTESRDVISHNQRPTPPILIVYIDRARRALQNGTTFNTFTSVAIRRSLKMAFFSNFRFIHFFGAIYNAPVPDDDIFFISTR